MTHWTEQERTAIEAVALRFSATWRKRGDSSVIDLTIARKRIAMDVVTLKKRGTGGARAAKPRLRFDKVATRLIEVLETALAEAVPKGTTALVTVTAPIRLPLKTALALEAKIRTLFTRGLPARDEIATIHGNRVRIRLLRNAPEPTPKMIGFVHDPGTDPLLLLNVTGELIELLGARAGRRQKTPANERWLVVAGPQGTSSLELCRYICSKLGLATPLKKILMVSADGRVRVLSG